VSSTENLRLELASRIPIGLRDAKTGAVLFRPGRLGFQHDPVILRELNQAFRFGLDAHIKSPENITTNILADRLKRLESEGIVEKERYQDNPPRFEYRLTQKGKDLSPLMKGMVTWANRYRKEVILGGISTGAARKGPRRSAGNVGVIPPRGD
jgi:DNA-binding HxlR family transcriptional regulator